MCLYGVGALSQLPIFFPDHTHCSVRLQKAPKYCNKLSHILKSSARRHHCVINETWDELKGKLLMEHISYIPLHCFTLPSLHLEPVFIERAQCKLQRGGLQYYPCAYSLEPAFIRKRNERERHRVRCVNEGYARLRERLPMEFDDKRLSKVETLRAAIQYIKHLQSLLDLNISGSVEASQ
ncbi:uncharacterized protein LOC130927951 [Corythoichthys intestinalis]|uniref:uncharacterized protein LOC130927951 n=1 Tax=Corythoichthys intestinalis TaxID=161448 RepID=UPI0025A5356F|nr:uncharacterized protein LOC130927951 [Corythoichthys intestinalis]